MSPAFKRKALPLSVFSEERSGKNCKRDVVDRDNTNQCKPIFQSGSVGQEKGWKLEILREI